MGKLSRVRSHRATGLAYGAGRKQSLGPAENQEQDQRGPVQRRGAHQIGIARKKSPPLALVLVDSAVFATMGPNWGDPRIEQEGTVWMVRSYLLIASYWGMFGAVGVQPAIAQLNEKLKLWPQDATSSFGNTVAIDGNLVLVGAPFDEQSGYRAGAAYLYRADTGEQLFKLVATDGEAGDQFGISVSIDGDLIAIGAHWDDDGGSESGSAYLFDATTGIQLTKLSASDAASGDQFGSAIALDQGTVVVGAGYDDQAGSAYLFDAETGLQLGKLIADDRERFSWFGYAVDIDGDLVCVGAYGVDGSGAVYIFDSATGLQLHRLSPNNSVPGDRFGISVAIDDGMVLVGDHVAGVQNSGAAYLFDAVTALQVAKLLPDDSSQFDNFGLGVSMDAGLAVVGAPYDNESGFQSGAAYTFDVASGSRVSKLLASDGEASDLLGWRVAVHQGKAVVGAPSDFHDGRYSGSAYLFDVAAECPPDLTGDGEVDTRDFVVFLNAWASRDPISDWDDNGVIDSRDFIAYMNAWVMGCG